MRYKVVGNRRVYRTRPGDFIDVTLSEAMERVLIEAGHIVPAPKKARPGKGVVLVKKD